MRYLFILFAVLAGLVSAPIAAADFSVSTSQPETIYAGNTTSFSATITNSGADDWFSIAVLGTYPSWVAVDKQNVFIRSGSSASITVQVTPAPDALPNNYQYSIIISRAGSKESVEKQVLVNVLQANPVIISESSLSCNVCRPSESVTVSVTLKNIGYRSLTNTKLVFTIGERTKTIPVTSLDFGVAKSFSTDFYIEPMAAPGEYKIDVKLLQDTLTLVKKTISFSVPSVSEVKTSKNISSSIFGNSIILTSKNEGNAPKTAEIKSEVLSAWYSVYSGPKPSSVSGSTYSWAVSLAPNETIIMAYSEIFWPIPLLLVALVFIASYYYVAAMSLSIRKHIIRKLPISEGGEVSVSLDIKSGFSPIENVIVRDIVPKEFVIVGKFETIKPVVRKIPTGTELVWRLGRLKSKEERVLHYKIKALTSKTVRLHTAELNGKRGNKPVSRTSNFLVLYGKESKPQKMIKVVIQK